jgi:hypothetical protein
MKPADGINIMDAEKVDHPIRVSNTLAERRMTTMLPMIVLTGMVVAVIALRYFLSGRTKTKGPLFTRQTMRGMRLLAVLIGLLLEGISLYDMISSGTAPMNFPIMAVVLLGYGFWSDKWLPRLRGWFRNMIGTDNYLPSEPQDETRPVSPRTLRFLIAVPVILIVSALVLYGGYWVATHPNDPNFLVIAIGLGILLILVRVFALSKAIKNLSKRPE